MVHAVSAAEAWRPDLCFSHNTGAFEIEKELVERWPVVKMMHGYLGTCVSGQKSFGFPWREPCDCRFGAQCLALYLPRRCGHRSPAVMMREYKWARAQRSLFDRYAAVVVASEHMRREFARNGVPGRRAPRYPPVRAIERRLRRSAAEASGPHPLSGAHDAAQGRRPPD